MVGIRVEDEWPIVCVRFPNGEISDEHFERYLEASRRLIDERPGAYGLLIDCGLRPHLTARQRARQAAYLDEHREQMVALCRGQAFVLTSALNRGFLRAIFWLSPPQVPYAIFETPSEARAWLRSKLQVDEEVA